MTTRISYFALGAIAVLALYIWIPEKKEPTPLIQLEDKFLLASNTPSLRTNVYSFQQFLNAIQTVEVGDYGPSIGIGMEGDNGNALGPFQIHCGYHSDAMEMNSKYNILYDYEECCFNYDYAAATVYLYMARYVNRQTKLNLNNDRLTLKDCEKMARLHNGGPLGDLRYSTLPFWNKVKIQLGQ